MPNNETIEEFSGEEIITPEWSPQIVGGLLDEGAAEIEIEMVGSDVSISPFDPDFLLFALPFAFIVDALDIFFEVGGIVVIPKIIGIIIDFIISLILVFPGWMYWRLGKIEKSKREYREKLQRAVQKSINQLSKAQKLGKVSPQVFERYMRLYEKQMGTISKAAARAVRKPAARALVRGGILFLGEIVWILGVIPFWTIGVLLALREK